MDRWTATGALLGAILGFAGVLTYFWWVNQRGRKQRWKR